MWQVAHLNYSAAPTQALWAAQWNKDNHTTKDRKCSHNTAIMHCCFCTLRVFSNWLVMRVIIPMAAMNDRRESTCTGMNMENDKEQYSIPMAAMNDRRESTCTITKQARRKEQNHCKTRLCTSKWSPASSQFKWQNHQPQISCWCASLHSLLAPLFRNKVIFTPGSLLCAPCGNA